MSSAPHAVALPTQSHAAAATGPVLLNSVRWLIHDTFRQALASKVFWVMLAVSGACTLFCLSVSVESGLSPRLPGDTELYTLDNQPFTGANATRQGYIRLLGIVQVPFNRHTSEAVRFLQTVLASLVAGAIGFVLTLIWTAGFLPDFLQPSNASVLFAKPAPRWVLVLGKYLGVVGFVAFQVAVFFGGTWLALAVRTDVWDYGYLAAVPLFVLEFAMIYGFTVMLAVMTRSTVACTFGSILFWLLCWGMNVGRHFALGFESLTQGAVTLGGFSRFLVEAGYWLLPKPADIAMLMEQALGAAGNTATLSGQAELQAVFQTGQFYPELSILTSLVFTAVMLWIAARQLRKAEY